MICFGSVDSMVLPGSWCGRLARLACDVEQRDISCESSGLCDGYYEGGHLSNRQMVLVACGRNEE